MQVEEEVVSLVHDEQSLFSIGKAFEVTLLLDHMSRDVFQELVKPPDAALFNSHQSIIAEHKADVLDVLTIAYQLRHSESNACLASARWSLQHDFTLGALQVLAEIGSGTELTVVWLPVNGVKAVLSGFKKLSILVLEVSRNGEQVLDFVAVFLGGHLEMLEPHDPLHERTDILEN